MKNSELCSRVHYFLNLSQSRRIKMKYIQETVVGQNGKNICPGAVSLLRHWSVRLMKHKCIDTRL